MMIPVNWKLRGMFSLQAAQGTKAKRDDGISENLLLIYRKFRYFLETGSITQNTAIKFFSHILVHFATVCGFIYQ